jgi:hypothetical protein
MTKYSINLTVEVFNPVGLLELNSPVLLLRKTTGGPVVVGTRYREVVQMAPFIKSEILSEITRHDQYSVLKETSVGGGMMGTPTYFFNIAGQGTELIQHVQIEIHWLLKLFDPVIAELYAKVAQYRLGCRLYWRPDEVLTYGRLSGSA